MAFVAAIVPALITGGATALGGALTYFGLRSASRQANQSIEAAAHSISEVATSINSVSKAIAGPTLTNAAEILGKHHQESARILQEGMLEVAQSIHFVGEVTQETANQLKQAIDKLGTSTDNNVNKVIAALTEASSNVTKGILSLSNAIRLFAFMWIFGLLLDGFAGAHLCYQSPANCLSAIGTLLSDNILSTVVSPYFWIFLLIAIIFTKQIHQAAVLSLEKKSAELRRCAAQLSRIGTIRPIVGDNVPPGWTLCDGREINLKNEPHLSLLASVLGKRFDTAKEPVQRLPDLRGRCLFGSGHGVMFPGQHGGAALPTNRVVGSYGGAERVKLTTDEMPSHAHTTTEQPHTHPAYGIHFSPEKSHSVNKANHLLAWPYWTAENLSECRTQSETQDIRGVKTNLTVNAAGKSESHENMPPYVVVNFIINYGM